MLPKHRRYQRLRKLVDRLKYQWTALQPSPERGPLQMEKVLNHAVRLNFRTVLYIEVL